ncbi:MAG: hypothetical protein J1F43_06695 [Muribaculaceae bacterium]|nr:hypothetical protein [Muribaculaceae bacterium]
MNKPVFKYSKIWYAASAILTIPLLIDICTACHLFSLWIAWLLFILIGAISCVRLWFGFRQHLYKFSWGLIGQLLLGAAVLIFFQLSYNRVIETPVSNPITPAVVNITDPFHELDSTHKITSKKNIKEISNDKENIKKGGKK